MCSKKMNLLVVMCCCIIFMFVIASGKKTTTTESTKNARKIPPTPPINCNSASRQVCGRNRSGNCRRFQNICLLRQANCPEGKTPNVWTNVAIAQCRTIRLGATARCQATPVCPRQPVKCNKAGPRICARSRDRKQCQLVANRCIFNNLNCRSKPRGNWLRANERHCQKMSLGEKPTECT